MPASAFAGCTDTCGWTAAVISCLAFGSFGVPIKAVSTKIDLDPLVMQSFKTLVCFLTCWLVIFLGEEVRFTPWGIVSGLFWVPGATCGIYAIRNAGLAVAVGTWSSITVLTSFVWGILIFHEEIKNIGTTACAFALLTTGLIGMSRYSKPPPARVVPLVRSNSFVDEDMTMSDSDSEIGIETKPSRMAPKRKMREGKEEKPMSPSSSSLPLEIAHLLEDGNGGDTSDAKGLASKDRVVFLGGRVAFTRRQLGIAGAVVNGAWGSTNLIPLHFASKEGFGGAAYLISYATGSLLVNIVMWIACILYFIQQKKGDIREALGSLPSWHLRELWGPGLLAGCFYSIGNFASILSVTYLGQAVGYSFCQGSILISGLWGIFYYKEITGRTVIFKWFLSASIAITGILWLSYEHQGSAGHR